MNGQEVRRRVYSVGDLWWGGWRVEVEGGWRSDPLKVRKGRRPEGLGGLVGVATPPPTSTSRRLLSMSRGTTPGS